MAGGNCWDAELYEAQHSFVWEMGRGLLDMLAVQPHERVLDVGCGTGQLTAEIAKTAAEVVGLDSSPDMVGQARQNFPASQNPGLSFALADASSMQFDRPFDAVFSNAALHWMKDTAAVAGRFAAALKPGGRLVLECGGVGNIAAIEAAIADCFSKQLQRPRPETRTIFHSVGSLSRILEENGFEIRSATLFDRPTPLEGERGMQQWLEQFAAYYFEGLPANDKRAVIDSIVEQLRPQLFHHSVWRADYRRLRMLAHKL